MIMQREMHLFSCNSLKKMVCRMNFQEIDKKKSTVYATNLKNESDIDFWLTQ
jgi:hypothetical protein